MTTAHRWSAKVWSRGDLLSTWGDDTEEEMNGRGRKVGGGEEGMGGGGRRKEEKVRTR